jgi:hypothetical protein
MDGEFVMGVSGGEPIPDGIYSAIFEGFEVKPKSVHNGKEMNEGIMFRFKVGDGVHKDKIASNIGPTKPTPNNVSGRLMMGLNGGDVKEGEKINLNSFIGKLYTIVVDKNKAGRGVVTKVVRK